MIFLFETTDLCLGVVVLKCFLANLKKTSSLILPLRILMTLW